MMNYVRIRRHHPRGDKRQSNHRAETTLFFLHFPKMRKFATSATYLLWDLSVTGITRKEKGKNCSQGFIFFVSVGDNMLS
ncbi:Uncharacterized protein TCM_004470 [Theobroma cacao]|uniref:Uncharacterized protein n=1 Tax=Theobroma cacao TaxID=3641 RepID=A0A061DRY1_THECC|nr:Uncharacterized protein TCM_004470 [Theobroma cacao]